MHTTTQTWQVPQSSQSRTTSTFIHNVSLRSVSNSKFWMPSRTLLSPSSLRDIWQQNEPQTTNKTTCKPSCVTRRIPPFKLTLDLCTQPYRLIGNNEWTSSWQKIVNYSLVVTTYEFRCLWHPSQGYTRRYSLVPFIWTYPSGANAAVPVAGSWRPVGDTHRMRPVDSSSTWQGGVLISVTSRCKG